MLRDVWIVHCFNASVLSDTLSRDSCVFNNRGNRSDQEHIAVKGEIYIGCL